MALGILLSLVSLLLPVVVAVLAVRAFGRRRGPLDGRSVRRFFQYVLLFALLVVAAIGVGDLLAQLVDRPELVRDEGDLARALAFVLVGLPVLAGLAVWTRRRLRADPEEARSLGWAAYLTLAALTAAVVAVVALYDVVSTALLDGSLAAASLIRLVVWAAVWAVHWVLTERTLDDAQRLPHLVLGSLVGWGTVLAGLTSLVSGTFATFLPAGDLLAGGAANLAGPTAVVVAGAPLWVGYWLLRLSRAPVSPLWLAYVLVIGVGVSLVMTVAGASVAVYRALVWFLGDPGAGAVDHLRGTSPALAAAIVGALSWWYHREVLAERAPAERTEVTRIYEYLLAAVALAAAATGVALVVVALVEVLTPGRGEIVSSSPVNAVLAAVTLLAVGGPLWWRFWRRIERAVAADPAAEIPSPSRRIYLVLLFGVTGVVAVVAVLVAAFLVLDDALRGDLGASTARDVSIPLGLLVAAGAASGYHGLVYRQDRRIAPAPPARRGPREVLLVGPADDGVVDQIRRATGARVDLWVAAGSPWAAPQVLAALAGASREQVLLLAGPQGPWVVEAGPPLIPPPVEVARADAGPPEPGLSPPEPA